REAILDLVPWANELGRPGAPTLTTHDLAALIYTNGNAAGVTQNHVAVMYRVLANLRRRGDLARLRRLGRGAERRAIWCKVPPDQSGAPPVELDAQLRQRIAQMRGMFGSVYPGRARERRRTRRTATARNRRDVAAVARRPLKAAKSASTTATGGAASTVSGG